MKIGIVTVFFTENCGSVLQATALAEKLNQNGDEVYFIDTRNRLSGHSPKRLIKSCVKALLKKESPLGVISKYMDFNKYLNKNFSIVKSDTLLDLVVIGSDTVWDINSKYFLLSKDIFWGRNIKCKNISTYAASIANSGYKQLDFLEYPELCIKEYNLVSVRDRYTKEYVDRYLTTPATLVCDPTLLHSKEHYQKKCNQKCNYKYILLYLFDEPTGVVTKSIRYFASQNNCRLVSLVCMGKRLSCADVYIEATIDNFLSYFNNATYIVTNTFHGTVFSTIFNKNFVVLDYKKMKIYDFLCDLGLLGRLTDDKIEELLNMPIDFKQTNLYLTKLRHTSENYINRLLKE